MTRSSGVGTPLVALLALSALTACADDSTTILSFAVPTEVAVDPADFLGDTTCSVNEGAMRSYVMTLSAFEDATDPTPFIIGSTQPTPCSLVAGFRQVIVVGQIHSAQIDGYDVPPASLTPFGGASSGSRQMRDATTGEVVLPRWTTNCGTSGDDGAAATATRRVFVRPCEPLVDSAPTPTLLAIGPAQVLGDDACELAPSFDVSPETSALPPATGIACDGGTLTYEVEGDTSYDLYATTTIGEVLYGSICTARAVSGVTVTARCNPLSATGHADVRLGGVMTGSGEPLCPAGHFFDVVDGDEVLNPVPLSCTSGAQIGPLDAGLELLDVVVYDASGATVAAGSCGVEIEPGKTSRALCVADD